MGMLTNEKSQVYDTTGVEWARVRLRESFDDVASLNPDLRIEQESNGEFVFMSPTGGESSSRNMASYIQNGVRLGWLIDPLMKQVHVYRPHISPDVLSNPGTVSAGDILPAFALDLQAICYRKPS